MFRLARSFSGAVKREAFLTGAKGEIQKMTVFQKKQISPDSYVLLLGYDKDKVLGVPVGKHLRVHFPDNHAEGRTYTPVNDLDEPGVCHLLLKVYKPTPEFPNGGKLTQVLENIRPGDALSVSGPRGKYEYLGEGEFDFQNIQTKRKFARISFIAGGSGVTPLVQILLNLRSSDTTPITLLYANRTPQDILFKTNLDAIMSMGQHFKVVYTVDKPTPDWKGSTGRITAETIKSSLAPPADDHLVFICGPKGMNESVREILLRLGYGEDTVFFY